MSLEDEGPTGDQLGLENGVFERAMHSWQTHEGAGLDPRVLWTDGAQLEAFSKYAEDEQRKAGVSEDKVETLYGSGKAVPIDPAAYNAEKAEQKRLLALGIAGGLAGAVVLGMLFKRRK